MDSQIAIIILNYNKKKYLLECIESIFDSNTFSYDLFVVDNASTDDSVESVITKFNDKVILICNAENVGGSAGFNIGVREALKGKYKYILLLDNDVIVDKDAIKELYNYLEEHPTVAAVGSKIYNADNRIQIQELGANINWETFNISPNYKGYIDDGSLPIEVDCDYVPACSVLIRTEVIREVGLMDESSFIYWDDIDWFYRMKTAGYRVVAYGLSKVWHHMGAGVKTNTFATYYFWRNRIRFFVKHLSMDNLELFAERLFEELYQAVYFSIYKNQFATAKTIMLALEDALENKVGKATNGRIFDREPLADELSLMLQSKKRIYLKFGSAIQILRNILNRIVKINNNITILVDAERLNEVQSQFPNIRTLPVDGIRLDNGECIVNVCDHIYFLEHLQYKPNEVYVDQYWNYVITQEEIDKINYMRLSSSQIKALFLPILKIRLLEMKNLIGVGG